VVSGQRSVVSGQRPAASGQRPAARPQRSQKTSEVFEGGAPSSVVRRPSSEQQHALVLGLTVLLTAALHIYYNLTFVQHQGRYLYPALIPIAVGFVAGWAYWLRPATRRWPWAAWLLPLGVAAVLGGVALFALWRILPGLAP